MPAGARAQQIAAPLVDTALPATYDRGHNVSVLDRQHPEYQAVGIDLGGFTALPSVQAGIGETDNALVTSTDKRDDGYATLQPRIQIKSDWSVHSLIVNGGGDLRRYFSYPVRNQDGWNVGASGRYDFTPDLSLTVDASTQHQYETRFSSVDVVASIAPIAYQATMARAIGRMEFARSRLTAGFIFNRLNYNDAELFSGATLDQDYRDRNLKTGAIRYEYELTPDSGVFAEASYTRTGYDERVIGFTMTPNRDSDGFDAVAGINFDLAAPFRGRLAVGYERRRFDAPVTYHAVGGVSVAARVEYFPTQLTTVTLGLRREIEDANLVRSSAYFANAATLRVDHEFLRNLILNLGAQYRIDDYFDLPGTARFFLIQGGGRYMVGHDLGFTADIRYTKRNSSVPGIVADIAERRAMVGIILQR